MSITPDQPSAPRALNDEATQADVNAGVDMILSAASKIASPEDQLTVLVQSAALILELAKRPFRPGDVDRAFKRARTQIHLAARQAERGAQPQGKRP